MPSVRAQLCRTRLPRLAFLPGFVPALLLILLLSGSLAAGAQTAPQSFHWIDFRATADAPTVRWVSDSLAGQSYSALREIGVQWDAALVVTTQRATPQSSPASDRFTLWSVSLSHRQVIALVSGYQLAYRSWLTFGSQILPELGLTWQNCLQCDASLFFTAAYYSPTDHAWRLRWMRGSDGAALRTASPAAGVQASEVYGLMTDIRGNSTLATWLHLDFGSAKPAQDYVYTYAVDPASGLDITQALGEEHATPMRTQLCQLTPAQSTLLGGQQSALCLPDTATRPHARTHHGRVPVTTPPANNQGQSHVWRPHP